jgi:hypothetical protein
MLQTYADRLEARRAEVNAALANSLVLSSSVGEGLLARDGPVWLRAPTSGPQDGLEGACRIGMLWVDGNAFLRIAGDRFVRSPNWGEVGEPISPSCESRLAKE